MAIEARAADGITCISTLEDVNKAREYWTPERRESATPIRLEIYPVGFLALRPAAVTPFFSTAPSVSALFLSKHGAQDADLTIPPFEAAGRLYFENVYGKSDFCTAAFTNDSNILLTAAHCVRQLTMSGSKFLRSFLFTRIYDHGSGEDFDIVAVATVDEWVKPGSSRYDYDYAFLITKDPVVNVAPLTMVSAAPSNWTAIGYPNTPGVGDGKTMMYDSGGRRFGASRELIMEAVVMEHGASGGPWIPFKASGAIGTDVFAVASTLGPDPDTLKGVALDVRASELFKYVQAGCVDDE
jgi:hypothetical protein